MTTRWEKTEEEDYSDLEAMLDDDYDDEDYDEDVVDVPDSTCVCLIRSEKENKTVCQQFDFEKEEWVHLDYEDFTGLTSNQVSILSAGDDPVKSNILMMYRNEYGNIDDKDFNKFCDDNKAIIELFRRADRFTYLPFLTNTSLSCCLTAIMTAAWSSMKTAFTACVQASCVNR